MSSVRLTVGSLILLGAGIVALCAAMVIAIPALTRPAASAEAPLPAPAPPATSMPVAAPPVVVAEPTSTALPAPAPAQRLAAAETGSTVSATDPLTLAFATSLMALAPICHESEDAVATDILVGKAAAVRLHVSVDVATLTGDLRTAMTGGGAEAGVGCRDTIGALLALRRG
jgi:hypothetical protein